MKKIGLLIMVLLMAFLMTGCSLLDIVSPDPDPVEPTEVLSADVEIINWVQDEGEVVVTYEITNTGTVDIAYYKIQFEVTYEDGSAFIIWNEKAGIAFAGSEIVEVLVDVSGEIARVDVIDLKLTEWKFK